jgi:hypothetical protein
MTRKLKYRTTDTGAPKISAGAIIKDMHLLLIQSWGAGTLVLAPKELRRKLLKSLKLL